MNVSMKGGTARGMRRGNGRTTEMDEGRYEGVHCKGW